VRRSPAGVPDLSETDAPEPAATTATKERAPREGATGAHPAGERDAAPSASTSEPAPDPEPSAPQERPVYPAAAPEPEPEPTSILRPPPIEPNDLSKTARAEPDEPTAPDPPAEEPAPSLLSRFNPARRRHAREVEPPREVPPAPYVPSPPDFDPEPYPAPPPAADEPGDEPDGEDLLEETPEFLEETPEHDRLWFEQRPPRDFDFDG
jgi:hypothetical protein